MNHGGITGNHSIIPDIPGQLLPRDDAERFKEKTRRLCNLNHTNFPGSQPVSFGWRDIEKLKTEDYWVCEKSDGVRVLVLIVPSPHNVQDVFLINRKNQYYFVDGFFFPHYRNPQVPLGASLLDGELVVDTETIGGRPRQILRLLIFDCLAIDEEIVMNKSLLKRTGRLKQFLFKPHETMLAQFPEMREKMPFDIRLKSMQLSYHLQTVLEHDIPRLMHGNDGLIYTCASSGYVVGTDERIMKWKPPSENSIDFKLSLRFPALPNSSKPDFRSKPLFVLNVWSKRNRDDNHEFFDTMDVDDEEWERMKASGEQYDDRIGEFCWSPQDSRWSLMRFRDDKPNANYVDIVHKICQSIADGVEQADLIKHSHEIRDAWKERERRSTGGSGPPPPGPSNSTSNLGPINGPSSQMQGPFGGGGAGPIYPTLYTGLAPSRWSRVSGPAQINGVYR